MKLYFSFCRTYDRVIFPHKSSVTTELNNIKLKDVYGFCPLIYFKKTVYKTKNNEDLM